MSLSVVLCTLSKRSINLQEQTKDRNNVQRGIVSSLSAMIQCITERSAHQQRVARGVVKGSMPCGTVRASLLTQVMAEVLRGYGALVTLTHVNVSESNLEPARRALSTAQRLAGLHNAPARLIEKPVVRYLSR